MKILGAILAVLIVAIQYPLWLGKGGWLRVAEVDRQVEAQKAKNVKLETRNAGLAAEVKDLKQGSEAIEERARYELGMIRPDEVFFQIAPEKKPASGVEGAPAAKNPPR
jgi:cell division protein FtsB